MGLYVRCCYYKFDKNNSITCEDVIRQFDNTDEKKEWMKKYCISSNYYKCPHADKLNKLYERIENEEMSNTDKDSALMTQKIRSANAEIMNLKQKLGKEKSKNQQLERDNEILKKMIGIKNKQSNRYDAKIKSLEMMCGYQMQRLGTDEIAIDDMIDFFGKYKTNWKYFLNSKGRMTIKIEKEKRI